MTKKYHHGLVPLSADPVTYGHTDLVTRAAALCDLVTVYVSHSDHKAGRYTFDTEERTGLATQALAHLAPAVQVVTGDVLLTDMFLERGCDVLVRGVRNAADEAYEDEQLSYHALIYPPISARAMYLRARPELAKVSSSLVKAFVAHGVEVSGMVAVPVKALLEQRIAGQHLIGVTGEMASGKSTIARELVARCEAHGIPALHIDVDALSRAALFDEAPGGTILRSALADLVEQQNLFVGSRDEVLARFRATFFSDTLPAATREQVHDLVRPHVERLYRNATTGFRGVIFYEWAQLVEMNMLEKVNNTVVLVESPDRRVFAEARGVPDAQYVRVADLQLSANEKAHVIQTRIQADSYGHLVRAVNAGGVQPNRIAQQVFTALRDACVIPHNKQKGGAS